MGILSVSTSRGLVHWQGLLLVASLLTFWSPPTTAKIDVLSTFALEGNDALLQIQNKPPGVVGIVWYKGRGLDHNNIIAFYIMTPHFNFSGPDYSGEEMITSDGSLLLKNVTQKDAGIYTLEAHLPHAEREIAFGQLDIYGKQRWGTLKNFFKRIKECRQGLLDDCIP